MIDAATTDHKPRTRTPSKLTEIGRDAMRKALLDEVERADWNLSVVAESLRLECASNVARTMENIGLGEELQRAREAGKVARGGFRESHRARNPRRQ